MVVQVGLWVVSEYGLSAGLSSKDIIAAIIHRTSQQRLTLEQESAALTALFKVVVKDSTHAPAAAAALKPFIKPRLASRDIMVARLSHFISTAISCAALPSSLRGSPGLLSPTPANVVCGSAAPPLPCMLKHSTPLCIAAPCA